MEAKQIGVFVIAASIIAATVSANWAQDVLCHNLSREEGEAYRVSGYDAPTKTWTIIRTDTLDGKSLAKRIILACRMHKYGDGETLWGRDYCSLEVGRLYGWKSCDNGYFEMVDENFKIAPPTLVITRGRGWGTQLYSQETQLFDILRYEVLPDGDR